MSDRKAKHNADAGSISLCGKAFFSHSQYISEDSLTVFTQSLGAGACINMSMHICISKYWYPDDTEVQQALAAVSVAAFVAAIALPE